jgi:hypothetical protein
MLFNFALRPITEIAPWGQVFTPDARTPEYLSHPYISWLQLTDGWYWIDTGQGELFRYSQANLDIWKERYPCHSWTESRYVDYYVVRLREDLLDMLPRALEPIPASLARAISAEGACQNWDRQVEATLASFPDDEALDLCHGAARWSGQRRLDSGYVVSGPRIYIGNDGVGGHPRTGNHACGGVSRRGALVRHALCASDA